MKIITVMNQKGGIGKTMTAASLAYILGQEHGKKVLLVDADQQGNVSMLYDRFEPEGIGMSELLEKHRSTGGTYSTTELIQTTPYDNVDIIPANGYLMRTNMQLLLNEKLSAFAIIEKDMLELGPVFLDAYIRAFLKEALAKALEKAIISGNGNKCPIGMDRDIHEGVSVSTSTGYPQKKAVALTSFMPEEYGKVLAQLAKTEKGNDRVFDQVTLICNMQDYLSKIMPATTVLSAIGSYTTSVFPFPTEVIRSSEMETGKAILVLPEEYFMGLGTSKDGTLEYSDEFKFLADQRVFKIKLHGMGKAYDNTVAILLDISKLKAAYIQVEGTPDATA